ncbi:MAG: acyl-CoA synthetase [Rickettsiales bacterium]|nr:acyl-CoA synthetase [Rickettsiales bacterium]|tara:strand:- start:229 stop:2052 length:1824 start_codon:yes stop_codon:yes gene_type:complete
MSLALRIIFGIKGWQARRSFNRALAHPEERQNELLKRILEREANTAFGKDHDFAQIRNRDDYRKAVPIRDYEGFRPYVDRLTAGEQSVLTTEAPWMFATTSGTTDQPKLIPVNRAWRKATTELMSLWLSSAQKDHPGIFRHKILTMVSPAIEGWAACGLPIGSVSGVTRRNMPWIVRRSYCNPYEVMEIRDYDARYRVAIRMGYADQVSMMATPNPSTLLRLAETGAAHGEQIVRAIHDGVLGFKLCEEGQPHYEEQLAIATSLSQRLRPRRQRARQLEKLLETHGVLRPRDVWPRLAMLGCWLGGSAGIQSKKLEEWYGTVPKRDLGFRATEGTMTVPLTDNSPSGAPALQHGFFEFIPEQEIESECPPTLLAHELEPGGRYYILLTTEAGLYRYDINDIIEVQGRHAGSAMFAFARKGRDMASITGEKIHTNQVLIAADKASEHCDLKWTQIQMIPDVEDSRYDLLIEPSSDDASELSLQQFAAALDQELCRCNDEYRQKRKSHRLHQPRVFKMKQGWYQRKWKADVIDRGKRDYQYKWPLIGLAWDDESRAEVAHRPEIGSTVEEDLTHVLALDPGSMTTISPEENTIKDDNGEPTAAEKMDES